MNIEVVKVLEDNYSYVVWDEVTKNGLVIDPSEPEKVMDVVEEKSVNVRAILTTHHHWDHDGGNEDFITMWNAPLDVLGGDDRITALNKKVKDGDTYIIDNLKVDVLFTPCHTRGHVVYYIQNTKDKNQGALFTGDTLFICGCGKFFEGTASDMNRALNVVIAGLPPTTLIYCGHEYTINNLKFAKKIEPDNKDLDDKLQWAISQQKQGKPTVPSTIAEEKLYNPYMRLNESSVMKAVQVENREITKPEDVLAELRKMKNNSGSVWSTFTFVIGLGKFYVKRNWRKILNWFILGTLIIDGITNLSGFGLIEIILAILLHFKNTEFLAKLCIILMLLIFESKKLGTPSSISTFNVICISLLLLSVVFSIKRRKVKS